MFAEFSEKITQCSGGQFVLEPYPADSIVPAWKEFDGVHEGALDYGMCGSGAWKDKFPTGGLFMSMVGGLSATETIMWLLAGGGAELMQRMAEGYNVHFVHGMWPTPETFLYSTKALKSLADIEGLKIRTAGDDGVIFTMMGASCISMPGGELYEAMQRGVVDAMQYTSPANDYSMGFHEVSPYAYISPARQPTDYAAFTVNKDAWAKLPDNFKAIFEECALAMGTKYYAELARADLEALEKYKEYGVQVEPIPEDIESEVVRVSVEFYDEQSAKDPFFAEVVNSMREFQKLIRGGFPRL